MKQFCDIVVSEDIITKLKNYIFYALYQLCLVQYAKVFLVDIIFKTKNNKEFYANKSTLVCTESYFGIGQIASSYEYVKCVSYENNYVLVEYVSGETTLLYTHEAKQVYNVLSSNLNYHVRYNKVDIESVSKYIKKRDSVLVPIKSL
jgi:hypothetical protein